MPFNEDTSVYFNPGDFAEVIKMAGWEHTVIWEEPFQEDENVESSDPQCTLPTANLQGVVKHGSSALRYPGASNEQAYEVRGIEPDGSGMTNITFKRAYVA